MLVLLYLIWLLKNKMNKTEITNQDEISKKSSTGGGGFIDKANDSTESSPNLKDEVITDENETENTSDNYSAKPVDIAKQQFYESQKKLEDSKARFWERSKTIITVAGIFMGLVIAFLGIFWAYKISSIAEPIGGIKNEMQNIKDENKELKDRIQRNEDKFDNLVNKILYGKN